MQREGGACRARDRGQRSLVGPQDGACRIAWGPRTLSLSLGKIGIPPPNGSTGAGLSSPPQCTYTKLTQDPTSRPPVHDCSNVTDLSGCTLRRPARLVIRMYYISP